MKLASVKLIIALVAISTASAVDFCSLCTNHIACGNNGQFSSGCPKDAQMVTLSNWNIQTLLDTHNIMRNNIAGGGVKKLKSASKMMTLQWDSELAYLAGLSAKQCDMLNDECIKTVKYSSPGQNLHWSGASTFGNFNNDLNAAVEAWYGEIRNVNQSDIDHCCGGSRFSLMSHFLQLVQDRAVAIGCAALRHTHGSWIATYVVCNYSFGNEDGAPVYVNGTVASGCTNGKNKSYKNLCK